MADMKCEKCGGEMEEGAVFDRGHANVSIEPEWGTHSTFFGFGGVKNKKKVISFCCTSCGFLESYAK